jgi:hypothetical protein
VEHVAAATVFVDRDVELDGALALLSTVPTGPTANNPKAHGGLAIRQFGIIPNLKNTISLRTAYL